jgi:hypothetical protein
MKLFEITIAGRRFTVTREWDEEHSLSHQTYSVDGRDVPVERYLELIASALPAVSMPHGIGRSSLPHRERENPPRPSLVRAAHPSRTIRVDERTQATGHLEIHHHSST